MRSVHMSYVVLVPADVSVSFAILHSCKCGGLSLVASHSAAPPAGRMYARSGPWTQMYAEAERFQKPCTGSRNV